MNKLNIKILGKNILVKPDVREEKTIGGIIIPETAKEKPQKGVVLAVGSDSKAAVGENILYAKGAGSKIEFEDENYLLINENQAFFTWQ